MRPLLYLDTARLGQTLPAARDAQIDFVRLTAEEPSTLYFEEFLKHGYDAWPDSYQNRFPDLNSWAGVRGLKQSLRRLAGAPDDWNVLLASRSLSLVQLASRSMFQVCRNVLTTDLSWPTYQDAVTRQALASGGHVTTVPLRDTIFHESWTSDDVTSFLAQAYSDNQCDGIFLPAVDHLGIRVPIRAIVERILKTREIQFVLVDAAQAICHVPLDDSISAADFIVFGSHKWMRAGQPMGIGLFGQHQSRSLISDTLHNVSNSGSDMDPLLQFAEQLDGGSLNGHSETVNLTSLFSCSAAAVVHIEATPNDDMNSAIRAIPTSLSHWRPVLPHHTLRSGISVHTCSKSTSQTISVEQTRREWLSHGCVVTAYPNGWVRVSPPPASPTLTADTIIHTDIQSFRMPIASSI